MKNTKENPEKIDKESEKILVEHHLEWPHVFTVCTAHKLNYFKDYRKAVEGDPELCELCHPKKNDALGG